MPLFCLRRLCRIHFLRLGQAQGEQLADIRIKAAYPLKMHALYECTTHISTTNK